MGKKPKPIVDIQPGKLHPKSKAALNATTPARREMMQQPVTKTRIIGAEISGPKKQITDVIRAAVEADLPPLTPTTKQQTTTQPIATPEPATLDDNVQDSALHAKKRHFTLRDGLFWGGISILIFATGFLGYDTWQTNRAVGQQVAEQSADADEGQAIDESIVSASARDSYTVAATMPRILSVDAVGIEARIMRVGVTKDGAVGAPSRLDDTAWYDGSVLPGQPGITFIDGHNQGATRPGVFQNLGKLQANERITIEMGDKRSFTYLVTKVETKSVDDIDMNQLLTATDDTKNVLVLMTCGGKYDRAAGKYPDRVIVHAELVAS